MGEKKWRPEKAVEDFPRIYEDAGPDYVFHDISEHFGPDFDRRAAEYKRAEREAQDRAYAVRVKDVEVGEP